MLRQWGPIRHSRRIRPPLPLLAYSNVLCATGTQEIGAYKTRSKTPEANWLNKRATGHCPTLPPPHLARLNLHKFSAKSADTGGCGNRLRTAKLGIQPSPNSLSHLSLSRSLTFTPPVATKHARTMCWKPFVVAYHR